MYRMLRSVLGSALYWLRWELKEEWRGEGVEEWRSGDGEMKGGRVKEWRDEGWRSGGMEGWRDEGWRSGRVEGRRVTTDCMSFNLLRNKNCNSRCAAT